MKPQFRYGSIHTTNAKIRALNELPVSIPLRFDSYSYFKEMFKNGDQSQFRYGSIHTA